MTNSFDSQDSFRYPVKKDAVGLTSENKITVLNKAKNGSTTTHETSHTLGNAHTKDGGALNIHGGGSVSKENITETLKGVGIGDNNIKRNAGLTIGKGTLYGSSNGLENGKVISRARYERIMRRIGKRNESD